jgi:hypothetical protein
VRTIVMMVAIDINKRRNNGRSYSMHLENFKSRTKSRAEVLATSKSGSFFLIRRGGVVLQGY